MKRLIRKWRFFTTKHSYEIGLDLFLGIERYSMAELISVTDPALGLRYLNPIATGKKALETEVARLASRFAILKEIFEINYNLLLRALRVRKQLNKEILVSSSIDKSIKPRIENAFKKGDFEEAKRLYGMMREPLSEFEKRRIAFIEKKLAT